MKNWDKKDWVVMGCSWFFILIIFLLIGQFLIDHFTTVRGSLASIHTQIHENTRYW